MRLSVLATLASAALSQAGCFKDACSKYSFNLQAASNADWMGKIPDDVLVSDLSIPGTHNSMTNLLENRILLQCQMSSLKQQLHAGIRYIDVTGRWKKNKIRVYNGPSRTTFDLDEVFTTALDFLDEYSKEGLILRIHKDFWPSDMNKNFEDKVADKYLASDSELGQRIGSRLYILPGPSQTWVPRVGELRGKIMILQDFPTTVPNRFGIPWDSDRLVVSDWKDTLGRIGISAKWSVYESKITAASKETENKLHIVHTAVGLGATPYKAVAGKDVTNTGMNDRLGEFLSASDIGRTGIIAMDFPGKELIGEILRRNERLQTPKV
ncbi:hypothetical protein BROUX41_000772 [Berkeleyomyces rouxiae]|uniref:uncharacterized protein n=1 Tax=Berkeleyomyces rouxiae TaxID=2035830 RepID=UPI003B793215